MPAERRSFRLRALTDADATNVLRLNEAEVRSLSPLDGARLNWIRSIADRVDVIEVDGAFAGFVVTFAPGSTYDSENYRWFGERLGDRFYYLDRIALEPAVRRRGVATAVYDEVEERAAAYGCLALEVNCDPPNEPSLAFHAARGYVEVGTLGEAGHQVSLMTKRLP